MQQSGSRRLRLALLHEYQSAQDHLSSNYTIWKGRLAETFAHVSLSETASVWGSTKVQVSDQPLLWDPLEES